MYNLEKLEKKFHEFIKPSPDIKYPDLSEIKITIDDVTTQTYKYSKKILFTENYKDGINLQKVQLTSPSEKNTVFLFNKNKKQVT